VIAVVKHLLKLSFDLEFLWSLISFLNSASSLCLLFLKALILSKILESKGSKYIKDSIAYPE
jgi:hypothetical protein